MIKYTYSYSFWLLVVSSVTASSHSYCDSFYTVRQEAIQHSVKFAKEPFYQDVPILHTVAVRCAALVGVDDLIETFKNISKKEITDNATINSMYSFALKTPIDFFAAKLTKGGVIRSVADGMIGGCCQKGSLAHWCAQQVLNISLDGKINMPGLCDGIKVSTNGGIFCTDFVYKNAIKSQLSTDIKNNVWVERYIKDFYKNVLTWLKTKDILITV